jgi:hypothetical protein
MHCYARELRCALRLLHTIAECEDLCGPRCGTFAVAGPWRVRCRTPTGGWCARCLMTNAGRTALLGARPGGSLLRHLLGVSAADGLLEDDQLEERVDDPDGGVLHVVCRLCVPCLVEQAPEVRQHSCDLVCNIAGCGRRGHVPILENTHCRIPPKDQQEHRFQIIEPVFGCALALEQDSQELLLLRLFIYTKPTCFKPYISNTL